ncbi:hypothetical protein V6N13_043355 [Hibiscus sabdariffa]
MIMKGLVRFKDWTLADGAGNPRMKWVKLNFTTITLTVSAFTCVFFSLSYRLSFQHGTCSQYRPHYREEDEARVIGESKGKPQYDVVVVTGLPELSLERILDRLSPASLCAMVGVCFALRDRCRSDHFWEKHMKQKWGKVVGDAADRE